MLEGIVGYGNKLALYHKKAPLINLKMQSEWIKYRGKDTSFLTVMIASIGKISKDKAKYVYFFYLFDLF